METIIPTAAAPATNLQATETSTPTGDAEYDIMLVDAAAMKRAAKAALASLARPQKNKTTVRDRALLVQAASTDTASLYSTDGRQAIRWRLRARTAPMPTNDAGKRAVRSLDDDGVRRADLHEITLDKIALRGLGSCRIRSTAGAGITRTSDGGIAYRLVLKDGDPRNVPWNRSSAKSHLDAGSLERIFATTEKTKAWDIVGASRGAAVEALKNLPRTPHGLVRLSTATGPEGAREGSPVLELRATNASAVGPDYAPDGEITGRSANAPRVTPVCVSATSLRQILTFMTGPKVDIRLPYEDQPLLITARGGDETAVLQQLRFD